MARHRRTLQTALGIAEPQTGGFGYAEPNPVANQNQNRNSLWEGVLRLQKIIPLAIV